MPHVSAWLVDRRQLAWFWWLMDFLKEAVLVLQYQVLYYHILLLLAIIILHLLLLHFLWVSGRNFKKLPSTTTGRSIFLYPRFLNEQRRTKGNFRIFASWCQRRHLESFNFLTFYTHKNSIGIVSSSLPFIIFYSSVFFHNVPIRQVSPLRRSFGLIYCYCL